MAPSEPIAGSTFILENGKPAIALGTPGSPDRTVPNLTHIPLDGMDPYEASLAPRCWPLEDNDGSQVESPAPEAVVTGLARKGINVKSMVPYEWHTGSFQVCWRDRRPGSSNASTDPRRAGAADGY